MTSTGTSPYAAAIGTGSPPTSEVTPLRVQLGHQTSEVTIA